MQLEFKDLANEIVDSWNSHDLERILSHYSDDFELTSPLIKKALNIENGTIKSKALVRTWWESILTKVPDLHFDFIDIAESVDCKALIQKSSHNDKNIVSIFWLNKEGLIEKEVYFN
jgi:hypothetical protein